MCHRSGFFRLLSMFSFVLASITGWGQPTSETDSDRVNALVQQLGDVDANVRRAAATELSTLKPAAVGAVLEVLKTGDDDAGRYARDALIGMGRNAVPELVTALDDPNPDVRLRVLAVLIRLGPQSVGALPRITGLCGDSAPLVHRAAIVAIGSVGPAASTAVPVLAKELQTDEIRFRSTAIQSLGKIGPAAADTVPGIVAVGTTSTDQVERRFAVEAVGHIGGHPDVAVPFLMQMLRDGEFAAIEALGAMGSDAAPAIPLLIAQLESGNWGDKAASSLAAVGADALPELIRVLTDSTNRHARRCAATAIGAIGPDAKDAIPALGTAILDVDVDVSASAVKALTQLGRDSVPTLISVYSGQVPKEKGYIRGNIEDAFVALGPDAKQAIPSFVAFIGTDLQSYQSKEKLATFGIDAVHAIRPVLIDALDHMPTNTDISDWTREDAKRSTVSRDLMGTLALIGEPAVPTLIEALHHCAGNRNTLQSCAFALGKSGAPAVPALVGALDDPDASVRQCAAEALGRIGPAASAAVPKLRERLSDEDKWVALRAGEALAQIGTSSTHELPEVIDVLLHSPDASARSAAAVALETMGGDSIDAANALIAALKDPYSDVRRAAAQAIRIRKPRDPIFIPALTEALSDTAPPVRENAAIALGLYGADARDSYSALLEHVRNPYEYVIVRVAAAKALGNMRINPSESIPVLVEMLNAPSRPHGDPDAYVQKAAAVALGGFGGEAADAVPDLLRALQHEDIEVRCAAAEALGAIGPGAIDAYPTLKELAQTGPERVRGAAGRAMQDIRRADVPFTLVKKEIPSKNEGYRHYEFSLQLYDDPDAVFLARLCVRMAKEPYDWPLGFDEGTLEFGWLDAERLLHVAWRTCPQGQGTNTKQTHMLLLRDGPHWKSIFRDTQDFYGRDGPMLRYSFKYDAASRIVLLLEEDCYGPNSTYREARPTADLTVVTKGDVIYLTTWRFRLAEGTLEFINGDRRVDLDSREFNVYNPDAETRTSREFSIVSLARFLNPDEQDATVARVRRLNPSLKTGDMCSGIVLVDTDVHWRGANEKHYYSMEE